jgi:hypothetical protein
MGQHISYQGEDLGRFQHDVGTFKLVFVANSLDTLGRLLNLEPLDIVDVEAQGRMPYEQFKKRYLSDVSAFYPTVNSWMLRNSRAQTIDEYVEHSD